MEGQENMLFVMGTIDEFKKAGLLHTEVSPITPLGLSMFDQLEATGFRPSIKEIRSVLRYLRSDGYLGDCTLKDLKVLSTLIEGWDELKKRLDED
jgi:hypothetical protein